MRARLDTYDLEMWSILRERDTCATSVKELEEALAAEESTDEEAEMGKEKAWYDVKRAVSARQEVVEEDKDGGEGEGEASGEVSRSRRAALPVVWNKIYIVVPKFLS